MERGLFFIVTTLIAWAIAFSSTLLPVGTFGGFWIVILFVLVIVSPFSLAVLLFSTEKFKEIWVRVDTFKKILLVLAVVALSVFLGFLGFFGGGVLWLSSEHLIINY